MITMVQRTKNIMLLVFFIPMFWSCPGKKSTESSSISFKKIFYNTIILNCNTYPKDTSSVTMVFNIDGNCGKCIGRLIYIDSILSNNRALKEVNSFFLVHAANKYGLLYLIKQGVPVKNTMLFFPSDSVEHFTWCAKLISNETSIIKGNQIIWQSEFSENEIINIIGQLKMKKL
jgi:hypothetical protein